MRSRAGGYGPCACKTLVGPAIMLGSLLLGPPAAEAASFQGLGISTELVRYSQAYDVSADGSVVTGLVGGCVMRWTAAEGIRCLGFPGVGHGISDDGTTIVGDSGSGFRWTSSTGKQGLGNLPNGDPAVEAFGASADGKVVVGYTSGPGSGEAFRWTEANGIEGLGHLAPGAGLSIARSVSADGETVVGGSWGPTGFKPFRWTPAGGMQPLDEPEGGSEIGQAFDVSADGSVIVGWFSMPSAQLAFRWTEADGTGLLGDIPGAGVGSAGLAVSADGATVVGWSTSERSPQEAAVWDAIHGMRSIEDVLLESTPALAPVLSDWALIEASGVSADGLTIVGRGFNGAFEEGWIARLDPPVAAVPLPATMPLLLAGIGGLALAAGRLSAPARLVGHSS